MGHLRGSRTRHAARGAVMVEAVVVVSFATICFLGVLYFRQLYEAQIQSQRLARAGAMAHAMSACKADPARGLEKDLPKKLEAGTTTPDGTLDTGGGSDKGTQALDAIRRSRGGTVFSRVTSVTVGRDVAATTKTAQRATPAGFIGRVLSTSHVACGDEVRPRDDTLQGVVGQVKDLF